MAKNQNKTTDRRTFLKWSALIGTSAATGLLFGCGTSTSPAPTAPVPQLPTGPVGDIVIIQGVDIENLDPFVTTSGASKGVMWSIYDKLLERTPDMAVIPWLAESWKTIDNTTWELKLRKDVEFHNGEKFTAQHVKASIGRFLDPKVKNGYAAQLKPVKEVQVVDEYTVRILTEKPFGLLAEVLATYCEMMPEEITSGKTDPAVKAIGTGAYKFVQWTPNEKLLVTAADKGHFSGQPKAKTITWRPIPEQSTRLVELRSGTAHLITPVSPLQIPEIESNPDLQVLRVPQQGTNIIVFNSINQKPLADKRVRQALNYATDVDSLIKNLQRGAVSRSAGPYGPGVPGHDTAMKPYAYDPEKAKSLLRDAGFPNGFELTLTTPNGRYLNDSLASEAIAGMWEKVGVKAKVNPMEWGAFVQGVIGRQFDAFFFLQGGVLTDATASVNFHSGKKGIAWQGYHNDRVNTLIDNAAVTMDAKQREAMYIEMSRLIYEDAPWLFLWNPQALFAGSKKLKGWKPHGDGIIRLGEISL